MALLRQRAVIWQSADPVDAQPIETGDHAFGDDPAPDTLLAAFVALENPYFILGLEEASVLSAEDIVSAVVRSGRPMEVRGREALTLKRSLVNGAQRLELAGWSAGRLDWYKAQGCFTEIIRYQTRLFVPTDQANAILARLTR